MRILVIDDEELTVNMLREALSQQGYAVDMAFTGEEGESLAEDIPYDLIILDIVLPGKDGLEICKSIRKKKIQIPIMLLTGIKDTNEDIVHGLDCGADDYLTKPFHLGVLYARVRAILRRQPSFSNSQIEIGDLVLDTVTRQVWIGQRPVNLHNKEFAILEYLALHPNTVITRTMIEQHVWDQSLDTRSNIIDVHIRNLRAKLYTDNRQSLIETIRGAGYRLKVN